MKTVRLFIAGILLGGLILFAVTRLVLLATANGDQGTKDVPPFCKTVDEAAAWVLKKLPRDKTLQVAHYPEAALGHLHFSLGLWIRNNVPVWGNEALLKSVGTNVHPDIVGGLILQKYWLLARSRLPENERRRMEYFENTLRGLKGSKPTGGTQESVLEELNAQIQSLWPSDAPYKPYKLVVDPETYFTWEPEQMGEDLNENVRRFLAFHRSSAFYDGDSLRVGEPDGKPQPRIRWGGPPFPRSRMNDPNLWNGPRAR